MFTNPIITEDGRYDLAKRRAGAVKDYILAIDKLEPERFFIDRSTKLVPEQRKGVVPSRVEFAFG